jgi:2,3-bisphosphoglycerate-independent phosphoglycerate mutase
MSAFEVTDRVLKEIGSGKYDVIIMNYANCDMVGHSGILKAAIAAVEAVDISVGRVEALVKKLGGITMITADHGNAEQMYDPITHGPHTAHTCDKVLFILVSSSKKIKLRSDGILADIAPTMLELLGIEKPKEMTGRPLII